MTNEERDLITQFVSRVGGVANSGGFAGSVPSGGQQGAAPVDHDADALIAEQFGRYPEARYRITQLAFVQERALANAQQQIAQLQQAVQQMRQGQQAGGQGGPGQPQQSRGFFGNLFGGGGQPQPQPQPQQYAPPPQQQYAPQQQAGGMFQPQGTGFLGGALRTAAGVAGGVVAADALMGLFSGHNQGGGGMFGGNTSGPGGDYYPPPVGENSPWGSGNAGGVDPNDQGGAFKDSAGSDQFAGPGVADNSGWQPAADQTDSSGGWDQGSADDGGGWTDSSSDA